MKKLMLTTLATVSFFYLANGQRMDSGSDHSILVCKDGSIYVTGGNSDGQLGNDTIATLNNFTKVQGLSEVIDVQASGYYSIVLRKNGEVWVWGNNFSGQLGMPVGQYSFKPVKLDSIGPVHQISGGPVHAVYLLKDSTVWGCGGNSMGELGQIPPPYQYSKPHKVPALDSVIKLATGHYFTLALKSDSSVWAFGINGLGQLGRGTNSATPHPRARVVNLSKVIDIDAGGSNSFAVTSDGKVWGWGSNSHGQLGNSVPIGEYEFSPLPVQINGIGSVRSISAIGSYVLALRQDSTVWGWGYNKKGNLGNGTKTSTATPTKAYGLSGIIEVASGITSMAVDKNGQVFTWGISADGALGSDTIIQKLTPSPITPIACNPVVSQREAKTAQSFLAVYPNPTNGRVRMEWEEGAKVKSVEVFNLTGVVVKKVSWPGDEMDLSGLGQGVYFLKIESAEGQSFIRKIFKQ